MVVGFDKLLELKMYSSDPQKTAFKTYLVYFYQHELTCLPSPVTIHGRFVGASKDAHRSSISGHSFLEKIANLNFVHADHTLQVCKIVLRV